MDELEYTTLKLEKLTIYCNKLGLSYLRSSISTNTLFETCNSGRGLRSIVSDHSTDITKILEVLTESSGYLGRYLALVILGVGCTVCILGNVFTYENFTDLNYRPPGFQVAKFLETGDVSSPVESVVNDSTLIELTIPASGPVLTAVGLGIMLSFSLAAGLVPTASGWT
ncbi:UNVERIFIED_CONTAM: hypothetical protein Slati_4569000 [Sesamum latifolium]|uniref:Uncharacterized protein n=1 Tax=Sesamum latifolium TaxID=2727402 RepID=A0AAW2SG09_9LAMI